MTLDMLTSLMAWAEDKSAPGQQTVTYRTTRAADSPVAACDRFSHIQPSRSIMASGTSTASPLTRRLRLRKV